MNIITGKICVKCELELAIRAMELDADVVCLV
jgi:hypothetical protein